MYRAVVQMERSAQSTGVVEAIDLQAPQVGGGIFTVHARLMDFLLGIE